MAVDTALIFNNRFLGKIQNNESGRTSFWSALVDHHKELERLQAIDAFDTSNLVVAQGDSRQSIVVTRYGKAYRRHDSLIHDSDSKLKGGQKEWQEMLCMQKIPLARHWQSVM
ncbi:MAG: phage tail sheath C-terminal domain-containing protein [Eubacteriales bacterium]